jgi:A/G-specific adenine glycosylase
MPWRVGPDQPDAFPNPYHVLVSEAMLQQTQVATATAYFLRFTQKLPTLQHLADADEQTILHLWQGLGYYARARNLHKTAKAIVERHGGTIPSEVVDLLALPGIGPYTAGAISSLAFGRSVPLVDGNVMRVLCRLDGIETDPRTPAVTRQLWARAAELVPQKHPADFNSGLMELGATICIPRNPACLVCPVASHCIARETGKQNQIPPAKQAKASPIERRWVFCLSNGNRWLMEQRPATGRWASMWQFVTVEAPAARAPSLLSASQVSELTGVEAGDATKTIQFTHVLTHRRYEFSVYTCKARPAGRKAASNRKWMTTDEMAHVPMPRPHLQVRNSVVG